MNINLAINEGSIFLNSKLIPNSYLDSELLMAKTICKDRKSKIGTGDRSERIRTYNFPQGRITDHRINLTLHKLEEFMQGEIFDELVESLSLQAQEDELSRIN